MEHKLYLNNKMDWNQEFDLVSNLRRLIHGAASRGLSKSVLVSSGDLSDIGSHVWYGTRIENFYSVKWVH